MKFELDVGEEKTRVAFARNWFTGKLRIKVNGIVVVWNSALNPLTHFSLTLARSYRFNLNDKKESEVIIVKVRPLWFAGIRPQTYIVFWKGERIAQYVGY